MKLVKNVNIALFILSLFVSCSDEKEIHSEILAKAYVDILVVEDFYVGTDSVDVKKEEIFKKYSLTEKDYHSSIEKFANNREEWDKFFELANNYLDTLKERAKNEKLITRP